MIIGALLSIVVGLAGYYLGWLPNNPYDAYIAGIIVMMFFGLWLRS